MSSLTGYRLVSFFSVFGIGLVWEVLGRAGVIDSDLFPSWIIVFRRCLELWTDWSFFEQTIVPSSFRLALACAVSLPLATGLGLWSGLSSFVRAALAPIVNSTLPLPKVAIFPLILAIFGIGDLGKIVLIAIGVFYPLYINVVAGSLRLVEGPYMDLARVYRIPKVDVYTKMIFFGIAPEWLAGLKASLGYGFTLVIVSELTASQNGIGNFVWRSWDSFNIVDMYAGIVTISIGGWLVQSALDRARDSASSVIQGG